MLWPTSQHTTTATTILQPSHRSTCISRHHHLRIGGFRWSKFYCPHALASSAFTLGRRRSSSQQCYSAIYTVSVPYMTVHAFNTRLTALCLGLPRSAGTRKVKPIWILLRQETVSGSGISWAICKSAPRSRQTTMPATHHLYDCREEKMISILDRRVCIAACV